MKAPRALPINVPAPEIWKQVEKLFAHPLFAKSGNCKRLLTFVLKLRLSGVTAAGAYQGRSLAVDGLGKKNPSESFGKTEGCKLRDRLLEYYQVDGQEDDCVISIPHGGFRPHVYYADNAFPIVNRRAAPHIWNAKASMNKRTPDGHEESFRSLDLALQQHPGHLQILGLKALAHLNRATSGMHRPRVELEAAESIINPLRAHLRLPWEVWLADACVQHLLHWKWKEALAKYEKAIALSHGEAKYYQSWYAHLLASQEGRLPEAIDIIRTAVEDFGHNLPTVRGDLAILQIIAGEFEDAEETIESIRTFFPGAQHLASVYLALLHQVRGNLRGAIEAIQSVPTDSPEGLMVPGFRFTLLGFAGDVATARLGFEQLKNDSRSSFIPAIQIAMAALGCDDHNAAVAWLVESAEVERDHFTVWLNIFPLWRPLRAHPMFSKLVTKMKLRFLDPPTVH